MVTSECLCRIKLLEDLFDSLLAFSANAKYRQAFMEPKSQVSEVLCRACSLGCAVLEGPFDLVTPGPTL
jgi:hypothetical protein